MKPVIYGVVLLAALSATIASRHVPKAGLELRTFRKVSDAEFAVMREEAVRLVRGGLVLPARYAGERYFEVSCHGIPVMLVDNSLEQLVVVLYADREIDVPCVVPLLSHWSGRLVATLGCLLIKSVQLVRSSGDRIMICRNSTVNAQRGIAETRYSRMMFRGTRIEKANVHRVLAALRGRTPKAWKQRM
ncbi:TPA: hypothetical protein ACXI73_002923 [Stenotrophomonas maltophilia]